MADLKLPKLPDRTPVKVTITISPELNQALFEYANAYERGYGKKEPIAELIPAIVSEFLDSDRTFQKARQERREA